MDLKTDRSNDASVSRRAIAMALVAIVCVGIVVAISSTKLTGLVATLIMGIACVAFFVTRGMSERLDKYEIPGGWRTLIGKD